MTQTTRIVTKLGLKADQVKATIELLDSANTVPFIARYRKEVTGGLDEEQIRSIEEWLQKLRSLDERRESVLASIHDQGKLTPELEKNIQAAETLTALEDLYQPYKPKRKTRASVAREKGLEALALVIFQQPLSASSLDDLAAPYLNEHVSTVEEAWSGARDICAEMISDHAGIRGKTREKAMNWGILRCEKFPESDDERGVYTEYYEFDLGISRLRPHQVLAINRGEKEKILRVKIEVVERDWREVMNSVYPPDRRSPLANQLIEAMVDAAERLLLPAIERDVRRALSEMAESHAIQIFSQNLRALLTLPPLAGYTILGIDPAFRTGCKIAVIDPTGKLLSTSTIYPHEPQGEIEKAVKILADLVHTHRVNLIAIGNGTASRETELLVAGFIRKTFPDLKYLMVNEAGASVYSASPLARKEFPELDVSLRGAVSIARRVQDPLAELVKIDPRSIGVGMYQHDIDQRQLTDALNKVVESCVNLVGVDLETASPALLAYVAGIGPKLAEKIVEYRNQFGVFPNREALQKVPGLGPKAFEQAAGFLRIRNGDQELDASAIHPESYHVAKAVMERARISMQTDVEQRQAALDALKMKQPVTELAKELNTGVPTLEDILEQLVRPGRDPRLDAPEPVLRSDVLSMEDLTTGMHLKGTVRNVVDFGAFIDIGVKQDGLLHRSQIPKDVHLQVGDVIEVRVLKVEVERGRISLGWK